jgi:hypothetical protein
MLRKVFSSILLIAATVIGLGAFGHGSAIRQVHAVLGPFPIDPHMIGVIDIVWYFVSGCMLAFGIAIFWSWFRYRRGDLKSFFVTDLIGILYVLTGIGGKLRLAADPFFWMFFVLGVALLASTAVLRRHPAN